MKKIYSSLLLVIACLCLGVQNVKAEAGFWETNACSISLYHTGNSDSWYGSNRTDASTVELGRVKDLYLKGFWFKMWENTDVVNNETSACMKYYICKTTDRDDTNATWTTVEVGNEAGEGKDRYYTGWIEGTQNITLKNDGLNVNLLSGLTVGDYTLVYYFCYGDDYTLKNGTSYYTVTFTVPTTKGLTFTSENTNKIADAEKYDKISMTYEDDDRTDYNYDLSSVTALHTQTDVSSVVGSETASPYVAPADGSYLLEYTHSGNDTKTVDDNSYKYLYGKLTIHPVTHVAYKDPTTEADGNKEYWYCEENNVKRYWVDKGYSSFAETTLAAVTLAKLNKLTTASEGNSLGTLAASGNVTAGVFTPATSGFYSFTANSENVYVRVSDETGSNSASGTQTCTLECTAGTAYTVTCYNQESEAVDNLTLTIATASNPYTELTKGENDVTVAKVSGYNYNPTHTFTPTESGDYKFTISTVENGTNFIVASSSSIMNAMYSGSYVSGGSTGEAVMLDMEANHKYYIMLATEGDALNATFTISKTTVKDKAVYKDGTLTFYCDETDHSADGTVYKIINYTNSYSNHVAWNGLYGDVTKVVFNETFANATPDDCYGWFEDFSNLTTVEGLEYVNMSNVDDTQFMFDYCTSLTSITLPATCKSIGRYAFRGCTALTTVNLKSVPSVDETAFTGENGSDALTGVSYTLALDDNSYIDTNAADNRITSFASAPTYTRSMSNKWGTIIVPFDVTITGSEDDYDFYKLSSVSGSTLTLTKIAPEEDASSTTLAAGTPAIIRMSEAAKNAESSKYELSLSATDTAVSTTPVTGSTANGLTLTGTFATTEITDKDGYIIANNKFWNIADIKGENKVFCAPFRAYLAGTLSSGAKTLSIGIADDEETAIETLNAITSGEAEYYDLNGRRLSDLQQGVNLVKYSNGVTKKVIIK